MSSPLHRRLIADYVAQFPGTRSMGFETEIRAWAKRNRRELRANLSPNWDFSFERIGFRPDAYRINKRECRITLVEVQHTSAITRGKWDEFAHFFWLVDCAKWSTDLRIIDRSGGIFLVELAHIALAWLAERAPQSRAILDRLPSDPPGRLIPVEGFADSLAGMAEEERLRNASAECWPNSTPRRAARKPARRAAASPTNARGAVATFEVAP